MKRRKGSHKLLSMIGLVAVLLGLHSCRPVPGPTQIAVYPEFSENQPLVRVLIKEETTSLKVQCDGPFKILAFHRDTLLGEGKHLKATTIKLVKHGFVVGNHTFKISGLRIVPTKGEGLTLDGIGYYGNVHLQRTKKGFNVINETGLEQYLSGVLGAEMPLSWPDDALRAQAVASRSYALYQMKVRENAAYHVKNTVMSQVYKGRANESIRALRLVNETNGLIMVYDWKLFPAYFHSTSGGATADGSKIFNTYLAPLRGRPDPDSPAKPWKTSLDQSQLAKALKTEPLYLKDIGFIKSIAIATKTATGRADELEIVHSRGKKRIKAYQFRLAVGPGKVKSTWFSLSKQGGKFTFSGKGFGHGVGMSQWGTLTKAQKGIDYRQILRYYYPGVHFIRVYDKSTPSST